MSDANNLEIILSGLDDDEVPEKELEETSPLIKHIGVERLFGRYDYEIDFPEKAISDRLVLLYGDNGTGKTTLLNILWNLLSPADNRFHRTNLQKIPFQNFRVDFSNETSITLRRTRENTGPYSISVTRENGSTFEAEYGDPTHNEMFENWDIDELREQLESFPEEYGVAARSEIGKREFISFIGRIGAHPFYLADDRIFYSDDIERVPDAQMTRRQMEFEASGRMRYSEHPGLLEQELQRSVLRANEMIRRLTLGGTTLGSADANSVYLEVIRRLGSTPSENSSPATEASRKDLQKRLGALGHRNLAFVKLGFTPKFETESFIEVITSISLESVGMVDAVLSPYLKSLGARLDALESAQTLTQTFLDQVNGFLADKELTFRPRTGLRLEIDGGTGLSFTNISSGERQLVLLLCNALLARQKSRLFLVDEPELSLNVKWQRKLIGALMACTSGSSVQFVIATHSIELLTKRQANVVKLGNSQ